MLLSRQKLDQWCLDNKSQNIPLPSCVKPFQGPCVFCILYYLKSFFFFSQTCQSATTSNTFVFFAATVMRFLSWARTDPVHSTRSKQFQRQNSKTAVTWGLKCEQKGLAQYKDAPPLTGAGPQEGA